MASAATRSGCASLPAEGGVADNRSLLEHMFESGYSVVMGTNRRYAHHYDKLMERRLSEILIRPKPVSLSDAELDVEHDPVRRPGQPIPVRAWTRYPETSARIEGRAIEWTSRAVHIEWTDSDGVVQRAWVWSSAVDRL